MLQWSTGRPGRTSPPAPSRCTGGRFDFAPPELVAFLQAKVETGRHGSVGEVVSEALRLLERVDQRGADERDRLRRAWEEGIASGDADPLSFDELKAEARRRSTAAAKG